MEYILLVLGFVLLIKGGDWLVEGSAGIAKKYGISSLVIGLTIVAFGTSAPELVINLISSFNGNTGLAIGNALGSNIANILLILGVASIIYPLSVNKNTTWKEVPFSALVAFVLFLFVNDAYIDGKAYSELSRTEGIVLICFFIIFMYYIFSISKDDEPENNEDSLSEGASQATWKLSIFVLLGFIGLIVGGKWIVESAVTIASSFGMSETVIGLTVVAIGTSLPELATSAIAAYKRNTDIAIGNVVGSNIFNILWVLGISATIRPLPFESSSNIDIGLVFVATLILFISILIGKKHSIGRLEGSIFVFMYIAYISYLLINELVLK